MDRELLRNNPIVRGVKNLSFLTVGMIITSIVYMVGFILILNILGPRDYGVYATVGSVVGIFSVFTMNMLSRVVLREGARDIDAMADVMERTIALKLALNLIAMALCFATVVFLPYSFLVKLYIMLFSFDLIYQGFNSYILSIFQAVEKMQYVSAMNVLNAILRITAMLTVVLLGLPLVYLFMATLLSDGITLGITWKLSRKFVRFRFRRGINIGKAMMKAMIIFSVIAFIDLFATQIDVVMISMLSDYRDAGIFSAAVRFLDPIFIFRNLVAVAFFPMFVKMFHKGTINGKRLFQVSLLLGGLVFLGAFVASIIGPIVIVLLLPSFKASALIFSILVFYTAFSYMIIPFSNALLATHNELIMLKVVWIPPIISIILNIVMFQFFGLVGIAYATLVVQTVAFGLYLFITWTTLKKQGRIV